jgi:hypothetical protein
VYQACGAHALTFASVEHGGFGFSCVDEQQLQIFLGCGPRARGARRPGVEEGFLPAGEPWRGDGEVLARSLVNVSASVAV